MRKRIVCLLLTMLLLVSMMPAFALPSRAASNLRTSEACISILKKLEGFIKYPVFDYSHYSVGYGSSCGKDDYPNGITVEQADALLRAYLVDVERTLNQFADRHDIILSQNQFDSLVLFTYNCGPNWVNSDGEFRQAVIENKTGNSYIYAATLWSSAGNQLNMGLLDRRMIEADLYLNNHYTEECSGNYTYVCYDKNGGVAEARAQGYDCNLPACVMASPTRDGYVFLGWYSAPEGGAWITELTEAHAEQTLYAHWQGVNVDSSVGTAASYRISADSLASLDIWNAPGGDKTGALAQNAAVTIQAEYVDASGLKWGMFQPDQWVKLGDPRTGTFDEKTLEAGTGVQVTVTGDYVNVRTGPGTKHQAVSGVREDDVLLITEVVDVNGTLWGKFRGGWICLQYTDYTGGLTPGDPEAEPDATQPENGEPVASGTVSVELLNYRAAAGTHGKILGAYSRGRKVDIFEKATVNGTPWGRTDKGWICLTYVKLDSEKPQETTPPTESETTAPDTVVPDVTRPAETPDKTEQGIPGTVTSRAGLNIRKGPGTNYAAAGSYQSGQKILILEQQTVNGTLWGRTDKGWVSLQYVQLEDTWTNSNGFYAVVTASGLNVRSGPGVGNKSVGSYTRGQRIVILEQTVVSGQKWGRTDKGWVCMTYVKLEGSVAKPEEPGTTLPEATQPETTLPDVTHPETTEPETQDKPTGVTGVVTAGGLNIRKTPGTNGQVVGGYVRGAKVTILEQTMVHGTPWGRTDRGWISLAYVKLDEVSQEVKPGNVGIIKANVLNIRKGPGTGSAVVGGYAQGTKVTILETVQVGGTTWGRTDKGWISMDYVVGVTAPGPDTTPEVPETTAPETETTAPEDETTAPEDETTAPDDETTAPEDETTAPDESQPDSAFGFNYSDFVDAMNGELAAYDIVAKSVNSDVENTVCYEFADLSDGGSYGVVMYIELADDGQTGVGVIMVCDGTDETSCENLTVFATYAMLLADDTITEADIQAMLEEPQMDSDGNLYYIMERESGEYAFVVSDALLHFYMYPAAE